MKCSKIYLNHTVSLGSTRETALLIVGTHNVSSLDLDPQAFLTVLLDDTTEFVVPLSGVKQAFPVAVAPRKKTKSAA